MVRSLSAAALITLISSIATGSHCTNALAFAPPRLNLPWQGLLDAVTNPSAAASSNTFTYTHLEANGQLWKLGSDISLVVDPIASQLDFGIPWGYRANKKFLTERDTLDLVVDAKPSHCLLTMGLDDHTHLPTLIQLKEALPEMEYIVAPSCVDKLVEAGWSREVMTVLSPGDSCDLSSVGRVTATEGALVGPPWQKREIGFVVQGPGVSVYYEPHADVVLENIKRQNIRADVMVSPVTKQALPAQVPPEGQFTLVYGGDRTLEIAEIIGAKVVVPLGNGALDVDGPLAGLVAATGDVDDFERLVEERNRGDQSGEPIRVGRATAGVPLSVKV